MVWFGKFTVNFTDGFSYLIIKPRKFRRCKQISKILLSNYVVSL